ncbi:MAG: glycosyltransferase family 39 protein [Anaerolineae bacterium]|nr:glycosyltransferase family 39 protein [Anaerolineae bacterium]
MRLLTVGVGGTTAHSRRVAYGPQAGFGRATNVGPRYFISGIVLIMVVALVLRVWNLGEASLWTDEALTALRAQAPFNESLASLMAAGNQTPLYFWTLRLIPNSTETWLRLPSALLGLLGIGLTIFMVLRFYRDREMALWIGALLAVNPFHVWLSRTARPYAMLFVLALLVTYFFLQLQRGNRTRAIWIGLTLTSMVAYATHFTSAALFGAQFAVFAFTIRYKGAFVRRWMIAQIIAMIPALTWLYLAMQRPMSTAANWITQPTVNDLPLTIWNMTLGYDGVFSWKLFPALMVVTMGLILGIAYAFGERRRDHTTFYWVAVFGATLLPVFLISRYIVSFYVDRYFMVALPALLILVMQGWKKNAARRIWRGAMLILIVTGAYVVLFSFYDGSYKRADWRNAADYVAEHIQPGDAIMLERDNTREAFLRYYKTDEAVLNENPGAPIILLRNISDTTEVEQSAARVWVMYRNPNEDVHRMGVMPNFDPFDPTLSIMGEWLHLRRGQVIEQQFFNGVTILLVDTQQQLYAEK